MNWSELLRILQDCVPAGCVTTYGRLSKLAYGRPNGGLGIKELLEAAVTADNANKQWTNRVVGGEGNIAGVHGQLYQLQQENIPINLNQRVSFNQLTLITLQNGLQIYCIQSNPPPPPPPPPPPQPLKLDPQVKRCWPDLQFPKSPKGECFTWTGFDSAWTENNLGAVAWMTSSQFGLSLKGVKTAGFRDCLDHVDKIKSNMHVLMVDQPIIVRNTTGRRPVEKVVAHKFGRAGCGGVQPAHLENEIMFGPNAPIWDFLNKLITINFQESSAQSHQAQKGRYYLETFPALGNLGMFGYPRCPKYNPKRDTFNLQDWKSLCEHIGEFGDVLEIESLPGWVAGMQGLEHPAKEDQDKVDAVLCMLFGYIWWRSGLQYSTLIGDNKTGYMVFPCFKPKLREELKKDADKHAVPVDEHLDPQPPGQNQDGPEDGSEFPVETGNEAGKGLIAWLSGMFKRWWK